MEAYSASGAGAVDVAQAASSVHQRSLSRGLFIFATYFFLYAVTLIDALAPFPVPVNIVAGIANGICIAMLFIVAHDCGHGAFVPGRRWNLWLGRLRLRSGRAFGQPVAAGAQPAIITAAPISRASIRFGRR